MLLTAQDISTATRGTWTSSTPPDVRSISTDTRTTTPGDLFVALKGERFDAHDHLDEAIAKGACALVVQNDFPSDDLSAKIPLLKVADTLQALGDIAAAWRQRCPATRISIAGSSGKTTTKEMLAAILRATDETLASAGNFNNLIGLPLTLFGLTPEHRWAVLELGMNLPGELHRLTEIADPNLLLLVNVGTAHIGQFPSHDHLLEAKAEAIRALGPNVPILYNAACENSREIIRRWAASRPTSTFAVDIAIPQSSVAVWDSRPRLSLGGICGQSGDHPNPADVYAANIQCDTACGYTFDLHAGPDVQKIHLPVFGRYNVANAVAAAAAAHALGIGLDTIAQGLAAFAPAAMRSEVTQVGGVTFVLDCYNANPDSMEAALDSFREMPPPAGRQFLVIGDMFELGDDSPAFHRQLGRQVADMGVDGLFVFGKDTPALLDEWKGPRDAAKHFETHDAMAKHLIENVRKGDRIFFKGSRGNRLEIVVRQLTDHLASCSS